MTSLLVVHNPTRTHVPTYCSTVINLSIHQSVMSNVVLLLRMSQLTSRLCATCPCALCDVSIKTFPDLEASNNVFSPKYLFRYTFNIRMLFIFMAVYRILLVAVSPKCQIHNTTAPFNHENNNLSPAHLLTHLPPSTHIKTSYSPLPHFTNPSDNIQHPPNNTRTPNPNTFPQLTHRANPYTTKITP